MNTYWRNVYAFLFLVCMGGLAYANSPQAAPAVSEYRGTCDASAAVSIGHNYFIVANDEENGLRVYRLGHPNAVMSYSLDDFASANAKRPEMDIEAAAKIGNRIYWITSHGANKNAKYRPGRRRFLATDIGFKDGQPVVIPVGRAYTSLFDDLADAAKLKKYDLNNAAEIAPKDEGGINIEGLAATPQGALLIGFRNPIPGGNALVVTIDNPGEIIQGTKPKIGPVHELSLNGLGIRSIERHGDSYLIVAGQHDGNKNSRLFRWRGTSTTATPPPPTPIPALEFGDLNPEALFVSSKGQIYILSDDGGKEINGTMCKDAPVEERSFRVKVITP